MEILIHVALFHYTLLEGRLQVTHTDIHLERKDFPLIPPYIAKCKTKTPKELGYNILL